MLATDPAPLDEPPLMCIKFSGRWRGELQVDRCATVSQLREKVSQASQIPSAEIRILGKGKTLEDEWTLANLGINQGSKLMIMKASGRPTTKETEVPTEVPSKHRANAPASTTPKIVETALLPEVAPGKNSTELSSSPSSDKRGSTVDDAGLKTKLPPVLAHDAGSNPTSAPKRRKTKPRYKDLISTIASGESSQDPKKVSKQSTAAEEVEKDRRKRGLGGGHFSKLDRI
eukprot:CAMPEP_0185762678 /NCGR_PEP_ID=MMETSP1174-20130828/21633_1 /TAXON_ID=35687 /ORGANISM="Dictyocha speculum, Strain CCMP1381" /LENGTH=229 /DNA_ID=CAMNT_0028444443 /DNA_START=1347 /DNA_END=2036 /DNA_ORIENTATION=+